MDSDSSVIVCNWVARREVCSFAAASSLVRSSTCCSRFVLISSSSLLTFCISLKRSLSTRARKMFAPMRTIPMDMNTPATLKKPSSEVIGVCEYNRALNVAIVDIRTKREKPFRESRMLAIISEIWAMLVIAVSKLVAVPKYKDKNARDVIP